MKTIAVTIAILSSDARVLCGVGGLPRRMRTSRAGKATTDKPCASGIEAS